MQEQPEETEIKLAVEPGQLAALAAHPDFRQWLKEPSATQKLVSIYFDTADLDLHERGLTLRVRRAGDQWVQTIKYANGSVFDRAEWENPIAADRPELDAASDEALPPDLRERVRASLKPVFETRIERTVYRLKGDDWEVELCCDRGEVVAPHGSSPVSEIEIELKGGDRAALFDLARAIANAVPARLSVKTKSARGYDLLNGAHPEPMKPLELDLRPGLTNAQAFQTIARACLHQIVANEEGVLRSDPVALHQMRIGLRRLRSAISLFKDIVSDAKVEEIKTELKWLGGELAAARDLDVFISEVLGPLRQQHPQHEGLASLRHTVQRRRRQAYRRVQDALRSERLRKLPLETAAWIETGPWLKTEDALIRVHRDWPAEIQAAEQLSRRRKKIKKKAKALGELDPESRHKLRIQVKKTRYAAEFFGGLFRQKKAARRSEKLLRALRDMQTALGGLNDVAHRKELCGDLVSSRRGEHAKEASQSRVFAAGLISGEQDARTHQLLDDAVKAYLQFADVKPFWKLKEMLPQAGPDDVDPA